MCIVHEVLRRASVEPKHTIRPSFDLNSNELRHQAFSEKFRS